MAEHTNGKEQTIRGRGRGRRGGARRRAINAAAESVPSEVRDATKADIMPILSLEPVPGNDNAHLSRAPGAPFVLQGECLGNDKVENLGSMDHVKNEACSPICSCRPVKSCGSVSQRMRGFVTQAAAMSELAAVKRQVTSRIVQIHMTRRWFIAITILLLAIFSQSWLPTLLDDLYKKAQRRGGNNGNLGEGSAADPSFDEERTLLALEQANHHTLVRLAEAVSKLDQLESAILSLQNKNEREGNVRTNARADGKDLADFALYSAGGRVIGHSPIHMSGIESWQFLLGIRLAKCWPSIFPSPLHPQASQWLLMPGSLPGQCLMLGKENASVTIALRSPIVPSAFTMEHVAPSLTFEPGSAPRRVTLKGALAGTTKNGWSQKDKMYLPLGTYTYDYEAVRIAGHPLIQTFAITTESIIDTLLVQVHSNHGADYTCLYRIQLHSAASSSKHR